MIADPKLRKWLNHAPRPAWVMCDQTRIDAPNSDRGWAEVAEAIEQLQPERIMCHSGDGKLLRAKPYTWFFPTESSPVPAAVVEQRSELAEFAHLLAQAHQTAGANYQPLINSAMEFNTQLAQRLVRTEAELDKARAQIAKLQAEIAELLAEPAPVEGGGVMEGIVQGAIAAAQQAAASGDGSVTPIAKGKKP